MAKRSAAGPLSAALQSSDPNLAIPILLNSWAAELFVNIKNKDTADPAVNSASITSQSKYEVPICALSKLLACCAKGSIPTGNRDEIGDRTLDMGTRWDIERMATEYSLPACQLPA